MGKEMIYKDKIDLGDPCLFSSICEGFYKGNCTKECYSPPVLRPEDFCEEHDISNSKPL